MDKNTDNSKQCRLLQQYLNLSYNANTTLSTTTIKSVQISRRRRRRRRRLTAKYNYVYAVKQSNKTNN